MVDEWLVNARFSKNTVFMDVSKLPEVSGNLPEVSGNFPEVSGNFPEVSRNVQQFPKVSGSFLPASRVHRAGCTEGEGGDQVPTAQCSPGGRHQAAFPRSLLTSFPNLQIQF